MEQEGAVAAVRPASPANEAATFHVPSAGGPTSACQAPAASVEAVRATGGPAAMSSGVKTTFTADPPRSGRQGRDAAGTLTVAAQAR